MKKAIALLSIIAGIVLAQSGQETVALYDEVISGDTNTTYIGTIRIWPDFSPSVSNAEWKVVRYISVSNSVVSKAISAGVGSGDNCWWTSVWADRTTTNMTWTVAE